MFFCYFIVISPWKRKGPSFEQTWVLIIQKCFVPSLVEISLVVLEKMIFKFRQCNFTISELSSLGKGRGTSFKKLESPPPKDALCQVWLKLAQWFLKRFFFNFVNVFHYFIIISPRKRAVPYIWTNLSPHHTKLVCAKFCWNWPSGYQ